MTHYSDNPNSVRVDRFKESGKWYDTFEVDMDGHYDDVSIFSAVLKSIESSTHIKNVEKALADGFIFVCLEPYHRNSYPVMLKK